MTPSLWRNVRHLAVLLGVFAWSIIPTPAFAYLDPGTGSLILQVVVGVFAGALIVGRQYLALIAEKLGLRKKKPADMDKSE